MQRKSDTFQAAGVRVEHDQPYSPGVYNFAEANQLLLRTQFLI